MITSRKFRVWDGSQMHEPPHNFYLDDSGNVCQYSNAWGGVIGIVDGAVGMFGTGLTDVEGTEIYEGDIITFELIADSCPRYVVAWYERYGQWYEQTEDGEMMTPLAHRIENDKDSPTVIGNRYEDPHLLEQDAEVQ
jgi:uncharacterized phage protein (TIGR01671 family)